MEIEPKELHERVPFSVEVTIWLKKQRNSCLRQNLVNTSLQQYSEIKASYFE
jgi:hypothetical protein